MAIITFYSANQTDQQRFRELLRGLEHQVEFADGPLSHQHSNADSEVISMFVSDNITAEVMDRFPKLKLLATRSTGYDHIDLQAAKERGIVVTNVPRYGEVTVAEFTFALLLNLSRKTRESEAAIRVGQVVSEELRGFDLHGKTFGIIGSGKIGQHAALIAKGFGMEVVAYDPYPNQQKADEIGFRYVDLGTLAASSDVISLHAPATPKTHHIVDSNFLKGVKSSALLVNTARGELIDTTALVAALGAGTLAGAALDVLEHEELLQTANAVAAAQEAQDNKTGQTVLDILALKAMPNVIITPHNAFNTYEAVDRIRQTTAQNIIDFYKGSTPNNVEG
jgi:D-lactate dehydrogenase